VLFVEIYLQTKVPRKTRHICVSDQIPETKTRHVRRPTWTCPSHPVILSLTGLIQVTSRVLVTFTGHVQLLDKTCLTQP
jgi:hypothetical protein